MQQDRGPLADVPFGVYDMHTHPTLKTFMLGKNMLHRHHPPGFFFPLTLRNDVDALLAGGVKAIFSVIYMVERDFLQDVWPLRHLRRVMPRLSHIFREEPDRLVHECIDHEDLNIKAVNEARGPVMEVALSYPDLQRVTAAGRIAVLHSIEGAHHLNGNLDNIQAFYDRGVCHMIIPHLYPNEACGNANGFPDMTLLRRVGCFRQTFDLDTGLTPFGCELVDRMLQLGMLVDMCHGTPRCRAEILARAGAHSKKRPIVMSHVGVHALAPYPMNPTAQEIRAIADTGGVIGLIAMGHWLKKPEVRYGLEVILQSIDHMVQHGGEDVVAFGSDFDGFTGPPRDFKSPRDYNRIREALLRRYGDRPTQKFLGGNVDRTLRDGWGRQTMLTPTAAAPEQAAI